MKKIFIGLLALAIVLGFSSCKKDADGEWRAEKWYILHDEPLEYSLTEPEEGDYSVWTVFISDNSAAGNIVAIKNYGRELENDNWVELSEESSIPTITEEFQDISSWGKVKKTGNKLFFAECIGGDIASLNIFEVSNFKIRVIFDKGPDLVYYVVD
ncbi:MAG: hypothetical protein IKX23_06655 [Treponema sp.]|nr:hypothetical protein [Treponema sp.]